MVEIELYTLLCNTVSLSLPPLSLLLQSPYLSSLSLNLIMFLSLFQSFFLSLSLPLTISLLLSISLWTRYLSRTHFEWVCDSRENIAGRFSPSFRPAFFTSSGEIGNDLIAILHHTKRCFIPIRHFLRDFEVYLFSWTTFINESLW